MSSSFLDWTEFFGIKPTGVIHIGAHLAEEAELYNSLGFEPVIWVEALPDIADQAKSRIAGFKDQQVICATLSATSGQELIFYRAGNEGSSSSLLAPHLIMAAHPEVQVSSTVTVKTQTLDELIGEQDSYKFLCLDVQGAELEVLIGGSTTLDYINFIMCEVSTRQLYKNAPKFKKITNYLAGKNFKLIASNLNSTTGWGDALYARVEAMNNLQAFNHGEIHKISRQGLGIFTFLRGILVRLGLRASWLNPAKTMSLIGTEKGKDL